MTVHTPAMPATARDTTIVRGTALGAGLALVSTVAVFVLGNLGAPITVVTGWNPDGADLTLTEVVVTAPVSVVLGGLLLWLLERWRTDAVRVWEVTAAVVAIVSRCRCSGSRSTPARRWPWLPCTSSPVQRPSLATGWCDATLNRPGEWGLRSGVEPLPGDIPCEGPFRECLL